MNSPQQIQDAFFSFQYRHPAHWNIGRSLGPDYDKPSGTDYKHRPFLSKGDYSDHAEVAIKGGNPNVISSHPSVGYLISIIWSSNQSWILCSRLCSYFSSAIEWQVFAMPLMKRNTNKNPCRIRFGVIRPSQIIIVVFILFFRSCFCISQT